MSWITLGTQGRELREGETVVGSGADADWRIATADLMPRHFTLTVHGLNVSIRPTNSDSVVAVNDEQLSGAYRLLNDGDMVAAGRGEFTFSEQGARTREDGTPVPAARAFLIGDRLDAAFRLANRSTTLGRDVSNDIVLRDPHASRFHAEIRREAGGFAFHTMGSGGSKLNGEVITRPRLLREGDVLEIAFVGFRFTRLEPAAGLVAAAPGLPTNDETASTPTTVGPRATMESALPAVQARSPVPAGKLVVVAAAIAAVAVAALVWRVIGSR